jgi:hypothetical protein
MTQEELKPNKIFKFIREFYSSVNFDLLFMGLAMIYWFIITSPMIDSYLNINSEVYNDIPLQILILAIGLIIIQLYWFIKLLQIEMQLVRMISQLCLSSIIITFPIYLNLINQKNNLSIKDAVVLNGDIKSVTSKTNNSYFLHYSANGFRKSISVSGRFHTETMKYGLENYRINIYCKKSKTENYFIDSTVISCWLNDRIINRKTYIP